MATGGFAGSPNIIRDSKTIDHCCGYRNDRTRNRSWRRTMTYGSRDRRSIIHNPTGGMSGSRACVQPTRRSYEGHGVNLQPGPRGAKIWLITRLISDKFSKEMRSVFTRWDIDATSWDTRRISARDIASESGWDKSYCLARKASKKQLTYFILMAFMQFIVIPQFLFCCRSTPNRKTMRGLWLRQ